MTIYRRLISTVYVDKGRLQMPP